MLEIIQALRDTPLPTLLVIIGFIMLCVGFGLNIVSIFDTSKMNKLFAKIIGLALLVTGLVPYTFSIFANIGLPRLKDPFLVYYLVSVPGVMVLCWVILKFPSGDMQVRAAKLSYILIGALVTITVLWRALDVYFYLTGYNPDEKPSPDQVPLALYERASYLPYILLLGTAVVMITWMIFRYTSEDVNSKKRLTLLSYFASLCVYLLESLMGRS